VDEGQRLPPYGKVGDLLKSDRKVATAKKGETVAEVTDRMRKGGFSQLPVVESDERCVGMIHEIDLLNMLLERRASAKDPIDAFVAPLEGVVSRETPVRKLSDVFGDGRVAVVLEDSRVVGIVTKIDVIDFLSRG
jgi:cystathionine beta-synthase